MERHFILLAIAMLVQLNKSGSSRTFNKNCADPMAQFGNDCSCLVENNGFVGNTITGWDRQPSRSACRKSCAEHPQCTHWLWGKNGYCKLIKDWDRTDRDFRTDMDSGSKNCLLPEDKVGQRTTTRPTVNCQWGQWGTWTSCTQTCGGGIKTSTRKKQVQNGNGGWGGNGGFLGGGRPPIIIIIGGGGGGGSGGRKCVGVTTKQTPCNTNSCPGMTQMK